MLQSNCIFNTACACKQEHYGIHDFIEMCSVCTATSMTGVESSQRILSILLFYSNCTPYCGFQHFRYGMVEGKKLVQAV